MPVERTHFHYLGIGFDFADNQFGPVTVNDVFAEVAEALHLAVHFKHALLSIVNAESSVFESKPNTVVEIKILNYRSFRSVRSDWLF